VANTSLLRACKAPISRIQQEISLALGKTCPARWFFCKLLGDIARAKGMSQIARDAGLGRESLYKSLSSSGNPELATVLKVISALGLQLHVSAIDEAKMAV
jgi:probable addiction module antidote protein